MKCQGCGAQLTGSENFCPYCSCRVEKRDQPQQEQHIHIHIENSQPAGNQRDHYGANGNAQFDNAPYNPYPQPPYPQHGNPNQGGYGAPYSPKSNKSRGVMLVLLILFGYLGVHWFYTGHIGKGILYLFTGGLCGIGLLVDFFVVLLGSPRDRDGFAIKW